MNTKPSNSWPERVPVLIAGGGPVGMTLAALLAHFGIASLVIEPKAPLFLATLALALLSRQADTAEALALIAQAERLAGT